MKKKILLVGGSGFIGHNLALELKKKGHQVFVVDSLTINNLRSSDITEIKNNWLTSGCITSIIETELKIIKLIV